VAERWFAACVFSARIGGWNSSPEKSPPNPRIVVVLLSGRCQESCRPWPEAAREVFAAPPASRLCTLIPGRAFRSGLDRPSIKPCRRCADIWSHRVYSVVPIPTSCLNVARKGSRSDFRNRILRPITRRWGICFRSTQRYTVCGLTPRYVAAARTVSGSSSDAFHVKAGSRGSRCSWQYSEHPSRSRAGSAHHEGDNEENDRLQDHDDQVHPGHRFLVGLLHFLNDFPRA
jgi:hypothetical protein